MFRDEAQTHAALRLLLASIPGLDRLWTNTGPSDEVLHVVDLRQAVLSPDEVLLVLVAFDLWNGQGGAPLGRLIRTLGRESLSALGALLEAMAQGFEAIDRWIETQDARNHAASESPEQA